MAKSVIRLEDTENEFFHINYLYMWKKLNTAPYYVSGFGEIPEWIKDEYLLPSYVNLSKCMNPQFVPSINIVNKVVQFYNANIKPEIDTYQFLHENLAESDTKRNAGNAKEADKFSGLYNCYYFAGIDDEKHVYGAVMKLFNSGSNTYAYMITGITTKDGMTDPKLLKLLEHDDLSLEDYKAYKDSLPLSKRRTTLFKGVTSSVPGMMNIQLQNMEKEGNMLNMRMMLTSHIDDMFIGSLGIASMFTGDYNLQILKMGIESANIKDLPVLDFENAELAKFLEFRITTNEHIHIALKDNTQWNDYLIAMSEQ